MSDVYSGGDHTAAIAAITAAISARIVTLDDGSKDLDRDSLTAWLRDQYNQMIDDGEATSANWIASINVQAIVNSLYAQIGRQTMALRPDWPATTAALDPATQAAAVKDMQAQLLGLSAAVTATYANYKDRLSQVVQDFLQSNGILAGIAPGVERVVHDRAYIYSWVTDRGEISKPSKASDVIQVDQNDTVTVEVPAPPSDRNITHFFVWRATSGNVDAAYLYVPCSTDDDGWPIGTLTILDDVPDSELAEACQALTWDPPPDDLRGLTAGSNSAVAGFTGNTFCPSVNARPYAFPFDRRRTTPDPIVALGHFNDTWVVLTRGKPYYATAPETSQIDFRPPGSDDACMSADSVVSTQYGVFYASPRGVCIAEPTGVRCLTDETGFNLFSREEWNALDPTSIKAAVFNNVYLFTWNNGTTSGCYILNVDGGRLGTVDVGATAFYLDRASGTLYAANDVGIDALFTAAGLRTARWRGKMVEMDGSAQFSFLRVKDGQNKTFGSTVTVRIFDGAVQHDSKGVTTTKARRVAAGRIADLAIEVEAATRVTRVTLASSAEGLK
jgi:hypothetical protein